MHVYAVSSLVLQAMHSGFSVGPASEAFIFGALSSITFPLGALLAAAVSAPSGVRVRVAALLAVSAGAMLQSLLHEVFGACVTTYLLRARAEAEVVEAHLDQSVASADELQVLQAEEGKPQLLDDETAACAWVCVLLVCGCAPLGGLAYSAAHRAAVACVPAVEGDKTDVRLAVAILVAQLCDVLPSGALVSLFVVRHELSLVLLCSLALANLPAAMSTALLGRTSAVSPGIFSPRGSLLTWSGLCLATAMMAGTFAQLFLAVFPTLSGQVADDYVFAAVEGLSAGAMLVVIVSQYLPDATEQVGPVGCGLLVVLGVVGATVLAACGGVLSLGAGRDAGLVDLPNLTTHTGPFQRWGFGGAAMPEDDAVPDSGADMAY